MYWIKRGVGIVFLGVSLPVIGQPVDCTPPPGGTLTLSEFLQRVSSQIGPAKLEGAIVFVALERKLDSYIRTAMSFQPEHLGTRSPWSHVFLLAEPYKGPNTKMAEVTVRDTNGDVMWDKSPTDPKSVLELWQSGVIYGKVFLTRTVADYDDVRVVNYGVKWLEGGFSRAQFLVEAQKIEAQHTQYDFGGLLRQAVRLISFGKIIPGCFLTSGKHLFCSAFAQKVYGNTLGAAGDFTTLLGDRDTTPDDIWDSDLGKDSRQACIQKP